MEYLGKLHQAAVEFPQTDIWMDSCGEEELEYGLKRGIVGATSNPIIVGNVIKNELNIWEKRIKEMVVEMKDASEEEDIQQDCLAQQTEMFTTGVRSLAVTLLRQSTTPGTNV